MLDEAMEANRPWQGKKPTRPERSERERVGRARGRMLDDTESHHGCLASMTWYARALEQAELGLWIIQATEREFACDCGVMFARALGAGRGRNMGSRRVQAGSRGESSDDDAAGYR